MSSKLFYRPSDPTKEMFLVALHNIALDKRSQEEILKKGNTDISPTFGNTFISKIIFNTKLCTIVSRLLFRLPIYLFMIVYLIKKEGLKLGVILEKHYMLLDFYEEADLKKAIIRAIIKGIVVFMVISYTCSLLKIPLYFFVIVYFIQKTNKTTLDILGFYQATISATKEINRGIVVKGMAVIRLILYVFYTFTHQFLFLTLGCGVVVLVYKFEERVEERISFIITKSFWARSMNQIHRSCIEHNEWWNTSMGHIEYRNIMKEGPGIISPYEIIQRKMLSCKNHSGSMSYADYEDFNVIHCWHPDIFSIIDDRVRQANLASLRNKTLCQTCNDILNDISTVSPRQMDGLLLDLTLKG